MATSDSKKARVNDAQQELGEVFARAEGVRDQVV